MDKQGHKIRLSSELNRKLCHIELTSNSQPSLVQSIDKPNSILPPVIQWDYYRPIDPKTLQYGKFKTLYEEFYDKPLEIGKNLVTSNMLKKYNF